MSCNPLRCLAVAVIVFVTPAGTWAADRDALPDGSGTAFRQQMMDWSAAAPAKAARTAAPAHTALVPAHIPASPQRIPYLSSRFGVRTDPLGGGERMHSGIDIPGPLGSPVLAADGGIVTFAGPDGGYGLMIEVDHGNGLRTRYGHLSRILVGVGQHVQRQEAIGHMGSTGRSTGSHLHFEVLSHGKKVNPLGFLGRSAPAQAFAPALTGPFIGGTAPPHISRFAQARAEQAPASAQEDCQRQEDRLDEDCSG